METPEQDNIPGEAKAKDSVAPPEEKPHVEETLAQSRKPLSDTETPLVGTSRKKRGRRKRKQKLSSSDQNVVVREAGTESYDSSELSEVEFVKATVPEENEPSAGPTSSDKNAFPVSMFEIVHSVIHFKISLIVIGWLTPALHRTLSKQKRIILKS